MVDIYLISMVDTSDIVEDHQHEGMGNMLAMTKVTALKRKDAQEGV